MQVGRLRGLLSALVLGGTAETAGIGAVPPMVRWLHAATMPLGSPRVRWFALAAAVLAVALLGTVTSLPLPGAGAAVLVALALLVRTASSPDPAPSPSGAMSREPGRGAPVALVFALGAPVLFLLFAGGSAGPLAPLLLLPPVVAPFLLGPAAGYAFALAASLLVGLPALLGRHHSLLPWPAPGTGGAAGSPEWGSMVEPVAWVGALFLAAAIGASVAGRLATRDRELRDACFRLELEALNLQESNRRLEKLVRARTTPMLRVAHQLRAPLSSIQGLLEVILKGYGGGSEPSSREMLGLARDSAAGMLELVNDLLYLGHVREVELGPAGELVDLGQVARETVRCGESAALPRRVRVTAEVAEGVALVRGSREFTRQMVLSLVENGIKYTPPGGKVAVSVRREGDRAVLSVADTGIGIPEEDLPRVFEEFYRGENARRLHRVGTGLGLPLVRLIAELQGGEISVLSDLGRGSVFTASFPAARAGRLPEGQRRKGTAT